MNSAFSGAPDGKPAPTDRSLASEATVRQLLRTGGELRAWTSTGRDTTDDGFTLLSPAYSTALGVEFRQPLLRGRAVDSARLGLRVAAAEHARAEASLRREVSETVAAVEGAYWALVAAREEVSVREEAVRLATTQSSETEARIEGGALPETEIAQPRAEIERRRGELFASREAVSRLESALKLLILGDGDTDSWSRPIVPIDHAVVEPLEIDVEQAMARALASRPELDAATAVVERRKVETRFARDQVKPALDAVASYERLGLAGSVNPDASSVPGLPGTVLPDLDGGWDRSWGALGDGPFDDARIGLILSLPVGNRAARAAAQSAASAERQATAGLARARNAVRAEVLDAVAAVSTAYQRVEAARAQREQAEVQLGAEQDRFAAGLSTNFLVLTRQNDLSRARLDEIASRTDYRIARTELSRSTFSLLEEHGIEVETPSPDGGRAPETAAQDSASEPVEAAHG